MSIYSSMAKDLDDKLNILLCRICGYKQPLKEEEIARSLQSGWQKHCGKTMCWELEPTDETS